jgi:glycosyltransferase involved in cell wall biosynthesis
VTFRDWLKKDSIKMQQQKFALRGEREEAILKIAGNVTGRTEFDRFYTEKCNPDAKYYFMNETLRSCFYEGKWKRENCEPHTIFLSQGDYPLKGLHYLLLAAGKLQEKYPDIRIKIAGNSLVNYRTLKDKIKISAYGKYLRSLLARQKLEDKVQFLGRLSPEEMKAQYLSAGLFVCCSSNENSPNSLGEAMLLGVPCVAADVGGIPSIFTGGEDGILYPGFGPDRTLEEVVRALSLAIMQMWEHTEEQARYSENAAKHARITHDKEKNYQKMLEIYAEIAGTSKR